MPRDAQRAILTAVLAAGLVGCAEGGTRHRSDSGLPGLDAASDGFAPADSDLPDGGGIPDAGIADTGVDSRSEDGGGTDSGSRDSGVDSGPACAEMPCRLVAPQCGCAAGEGCFVADARGTRACSTAGTAGPNETCTGDADCRPGTMCIGSAPAWCVSFCNADSDCPTAGQLCIGQIDDGAGGAVPGVTLCTTACDPLRLTGCPAGVGCTILREASGAMRAFTHCRPEGAGSQGSFCSDEEDCRAGHACAGGACARWCRLPGGTECTGGTVCRTLSSPVTIAGVQYGLCG